MRSEVLFLVIFLFVLVESKHTNHAFNDTIHRSSFPKDFLFGGAGSAYQVEGGANQGGRGPSIWDTYAKTPGNIKDKSTGDVAADTYHRYKEDSVMMKDIGFNAYRMSISWSRVLPRGSLQGGVNRQGIEYYNNVINDLLGHGIVPSVTLFHWDLPQALEDEYGGFLSPDVAEDFADYADLCFREFGDRVKMWVTLNEPLTFSTQGYEAGVMAPGRCSNPPNKCKKGDSTTEPYIVSHNLLLAHASAVKIYRQKYQKSQKGSIGIVLNTGWQVPLTDSEEDKAAAHRALDFSFGWFMEPIHSGSYPHEMVKRAGVRLSKFTKEQSHLLKGSFDFIGLNYYSSGYAGNIPCPTQIKTFGDDSCVKQTNERNGVKIGPKAASDWLYIYPEGIYELLVYTKKTYGNPVIYVTENGMDYVNDDTIELEDSTRIEYYRDHLSYVLKAINHGVKVKGYFAWALLDNFEWAMGYSVRFGITFVDFNNGQKRYPKKSSEWFKRFLYR